MKNYKEKFGEPMTASAKWYATKKGETKKDIIINNNNNVYLYYNK